MDFKIAARPLVEPCRGTNANVEGYSDLLPAFTGERRWLPKEEFGESFSGFFK